MTVKAETRLLVLCTCGMSVPASPLRYASRSRLPAGAAPTEAQPPHRPPPAESQLVEPTPGGTLRLSVPEPGVWLDLELTRCCLGRTLVATNGQATGQGGTELRPDLAIASPTVSPDGLAWTFRLRPGVPLLTTLRRRGDHHAGRDPIRRAILASESYFGSLFTVIEGAEAFRAGTADSVAGLEAPISHTLVVHLARPTGDVAYLFAFPDSSPTPPGADEGHASDYAAFFAASGPYMYEGADGVDYTLPAAQQTPARGAGADGNPMVLIRNPSWDRPRRSPPTCLSRPDRDLVRRLAGGRRARCGQRHHRHGSRLQHDRPRVADRPLPGR